MLAHHTRRALHNTATTRRFFSSNIVSFSPDIHLFNARSTLGKRSEQRQDDREDPNRIVNYVEEATKSMKRGEFINEEEAHGTQGMSETTFRKEILEKHLDKDFGIGRNDMIETTKESG
jgi:hypothetical protein